MFPLKKISDDSTHEYVVRPMGLRKRQKAFKGIESQIKERSNINITHFNESDSSDSETKPSVLARETPAKNVQIQSSNITTKENAKKVQEYVSPVILNQSPQMDARTPKGANISSIEQIRKRVKRRTKTPQKMDEDVNPSDSEDLYSNWKKNMKKRIERRNKKYEKDSPSTDDSSPMMM